MKLITHDLIHDLTFSAHTFKCVCHIIRSMFRVLGIYNFAACYKKQFITILSLFWSLLFCQGSGWVSAIIYALFKKCPIRLHIRFLLHSSIMISDNRQTFLLRYGMSLYWASVLVGIIDASDKKRTQSLNHRVNLHPLF